MVAVTSLSVSESETVAVKSTGCVMVAVATGEDGETV